MQCKTWCRNGRESREMVPLRKGNGWRMPFREPVEQVWRGGPYRNGSKLRKTVPLWCVSEGTMLFRESETGGRHERVTATAVNRVKSCRCGKMGRSGEGTDVRISYRALLGAVRRVYSFGRSREMVWFRDSFGRSGKMVWFREPFGWSMEWNTAVWCFGSGCASTHLRKVSGKRGETAHLRKVG